MSNDRIAVLVGSLCRDSFNRRMASAVVKLAPTDLVFDQVQVGDPPLYDQDEDESPAASVERLKGGLAAAQGLLFVTPESNRSIPGVIENALDARHSTAQGESHGPNDYHQFARS